MEKELEIVPYDIGMELKRLGFDWVCGSMYLSDYQYNGVSLTLDEQIELMYEGKGEELAEIPGGKVVNHGNRNYNDFTGDGYCSAPTLALAEKWLRETYGMLVQIRYAYGTDGDVDYMFTVADTRNRRTVESGLFFKEYELAEEAGIRHALGLLSEGGGE